MNRILYNPPLSTSQIDKILQEVGVEEAPDLTIVIGKNHYSFSTALESRFLYRCSLATTPSLNVHEWGVFLDNQFWYSKGNGTV